MGELTGSGSRTELSMFVDAPGWGAGAGTEGDDETAVVDGPGQAISGVIELGVGS